MAVAVCFQAPVWFVGEPTEAVHEGVVGGVQLGLVTLPGGDPVHLRGGRVGVQEAVHDGGGGGGHRDLAVGHRPVVAHRPVWASYYRN